MNEEELALFSYEKLVMRFNKIDCREYYLSYSGGKDSHLLYWFIKKQGIDMQIVGINTGMEHTEMTNRILKNCDVVLKPSKTLLEIKEEFGIPCFTKSQDQFIHAYQSGSTARTTQERFFALKPSYYNVSAKAREYVLNGGHKISNYCCYFTKKKPVHDYEKETGLKPILGVRQSESRNRGARYKTCLVADKFVPLFDFTDEMMKAMYNYYNIELPKVYEVLDRTGCVGCPYEKYPERTRYELSLLSKNRRKYIIEQFKESYDVKGVNYDFSDEDEKSSEKLSENKE